MNITEVSMVKDLEFEKQRMLKYKTLAVAFSYPNKEFFDFFPELSSDRERLSREYDRLFRVKEIWLYGTEYISEHEFQRSNYLADISGFYKAFGLEAQGDRPDALSSELEFMHYLIFKEINAPEDEKAAICLDAQKKFFVEYVNTIAKPIAQEIIRVTTEEFYKNIAIEMLQFFKEEEKLLKQ